MIVVDTNVVAYVLMPGPHNEDARRVLARDGAWAAPLLWRSEMRNVLASYLHKRQISLAQAIEIQSTAESLVHEREYSVSSGTVLELVAASGCSAYDCEFVALARTLNIALVTSDQEVIAKFPETAVSIAQYGR